MKSIGLLSVIFVITLIHVLHVDASLEDFYCKLRDRLHFSLEEARENCGENGKKVLNLIRKYLIKLPKFIKEYYRTNCGNKFNPRYRCYTKTTPCELEYNNYHMRFHQLCHPTIRSTLCGKILIFFYFIKISQSKLQKETLVINYLLA